MRQKVYWHPLERTYDEVRRCLNRVDKLIESGLANDEEKQVAYKLKEYLSLAYMNIPKRYRVTYFQKIKKGASNDTDSDR